MAMNYSDKTAPASAVAELLLLFAKISVTILKDISHVSLCHFQQLWLKLQSKKLKSVVFCVSYRPADSPFSCFEDLLKPNFIHSITLNKPIVILGDLNCNVLTDNPENKALTIFMSREFKASDNHADKNYRTLKFAYRCYYGFRSWHYLWERCHEYHHQWSPARHCTIEFEASQISTMLHYCAQLCKLWSSQFSPDLTSKAPELLTIFDEFDVNTKLSIFNKRVKGISF